MAIFIFIVCSAELIIHTEINSGNICGASCQPHSQAEHIQQPGVPEKLHKEPIPPSTKWIVSATPLILLYVITLYVVKYSLSNSKLFLTYEALRF